ncbi:MAG: ATP-dependent Clp protease ATP-binding subunit ClpA, partial [Myxococcales bacterium]|nr:ATP-dependent Clp protease ATP-binding subunit ClpA [Myxococcales bacterium]
MLGDDLRIAIAAAEERAAASKHEFLTLEHLLYALLHDPRASEVLEAVGADLDQLESELDQFLDKLEKLEIEGEYRPIWTIGFRRVLQRATNHVQSADAGEVDGANVLVAMFAETDSHALYLLDRQGIERLDIVSYISHGKRKDGKRKRVSPMGADGESESRSPDEALADFTVDLYERAREGKIDPLIGRELELERAIHILARRRKNNPLFIGDSGVGKTAIVEGL